MGSQTVHPTSTANNIIKKWVEFSSRLLILIIILFTWLLTWYNVSLDWHATQQFVWWQLIIKIPAPEADKFSEWITKEGVGGGAGFIHHFGQKRYPFHIPSSGTAEGEGLVGPRPHHFFAPQPPLFENQILWFYSFFRFSIWKNYFQLSALPLFTLLRGPCSSELCIPFHCCRCTVFKIWTNHKTRVFSQLFHSQKMHLLAPCGLFTDWNDRFPFPFIYFNQWNPSLLVE